MLVGFHSPRQLSDLVSSGMTLLSPHGSSNQSSHMVPVITPTGYPPSNGSLLPQHIYRQPGDPGNPEQPQIFLQSIN